MLLMASAEPEIQELAELGNCDHFGNRSPGIDVVKSETTSKGAPEVSSEHCFLQVEGAQLSPSVESAFGLN